MNEQAVNDADSKKTVWCIYNHTPDSSSALCVKHPDGITIIGFSSNTLGEEFTRVCRLANTFKPIRIEQLGSTAFPNQPDWMGKTDRVMLISTSEELHQYFQNREAFTVSARIVKMSINYGP